ncbi:bifunctional 3-(3-hydroxy-phenyl)propionate/3-hydroxycinnamic acid hydroxylase [Streptomyces boncukensis]|uniref:Bifunctional 3-(3-hydroxy-phenyl)propionate/3-hydroxycinnamic acid hydroxylase n=1 Tax=Streptomyces boncukensis TaxID=2711219 RepID=A0A6G4WQQ1_9ACTN|nr:bifunctional 3-(3-hydroxy-phenyl)propionate/3-hydroxycinnamic acid hydroxylase [Streptomyces boncukensis]
MVLSVLLAQRGRRVDVVERWPRPFGRPRAVAYDSEAGRILAAAGLGGLLAGFGECADEYIWQDAAGETLLYSKISERGWCHWPDSTSMYQPELEEALIARGERLENLRVFRGYRVDDLSEGEDAVRAVAHGADGEALVLDAKWVVGCDGANSFVRGRIDPRMRDFTFSHDWLICDVTLREQRGFRPNNLQICDPARPRTAVSAGPGHRRWEFMRVPGETLEELGTAESAWRLLRRYAGVTPDNARLDRFACYTFEARYAERWRAGRLLLAGDAAHLMPPFAGQGMSSGIRDALNLAWKLDLVLAGKAGEELIDTYTEERSAHVRHAIQLSLHLGQVICQTDEEDAADLHAVLRAARERDMARSAQRPGVHPLVDGFLDRDADGTCAPPVGELTPLGRVSRGGAPALLDDAVGPGWVLLCLDDPRPWLDETCRGYLDEIGAHVVHVRPPGASGHAPAGAVADVDDVYRPFLRGHGAGAVLVRPDFYVFGAVRDNDRLPALVARLRERCAVAAPV